MWTSFAVNDLIVANQSSALDSVLNHRNEKPLCFDSLLPRLVECTENKQILAAKKLQTIVVKNGLEGNVRIGCQMISMFFSCGSVAEAHRAFNYLPCDNIHAWKALISGYMDVGQYEVALDFYCQMKAVGVVCNSHTFVALLKVCSQIKSSVNGRLIHSDVLQNGLESDHYVTSALIDMYSKLGNINTAIIIFNKAHSPDEAIWNTLIARCIECSCGHEAIMLLEKMQENGIVPSMVTYISVLKFCSGIEEQDLNTIHASVICYGFDSDMHIGIGLVNMYSKLGLLDDACNVFINLPEQSVIAYASLMQGYAECGYGQRALDLFKEMLEKDIKPDAVTFVCILKACACLDNGRFIHRQIVECGFEKDLCIGNALIDMYAKCGNMDDAFHEFSKLFQPDIISWNTITTGYVEYERGHEALQCYKEMQVNGIEPNDITYISTVNACACVRSLNQGKDIHADIRRNGFESLAIIKNSLIYMYVKCGDLEEACHIFSEFPLRDVVSWSTLIAGYVDHGYVDEAINLFTKMKQECIEPNDVTYISILQGCSKIASLDVGRAVHMEVMKRGIDVIKTVANSLIDMYGKSGNLDEAECLFEKMFSRDSVSWSIIIAGYAQHGHTHSAIEYFEKMMQEGLQPNNGIFLNVLSACNHSGLLDQGNQYFMLMTQKYSLIPDIEHYTCMLDLLGRSGLLKEAEDMITQMPYEPNEIVWISLLGACAKFWNVDVGERAFDKFVKHDPQNAAGYRLMANIYSANHMKEKANSVLHMMPQTV